MHPSKKQRRQSQVIGVSLSMILMFLGMLVSFWLHIGIGAEPLQELVFDKAYIFIPPPPPTPELVTEDPVIVKERQRVALDLSFAESSSPAPPTLLRNDEERARARVDISSFSTSNELSGPSDSKTRRNVTSGLRSSVAVSVGGIETSGTVGGQGSGERRIISRGADVQARETIDSTPTVVPEEETSESQTWGLVLDELIRWMRANPGELDPGIRMHVGARDTDLMSRVTVAASPTDYQMFLTVKGGRELHLVLVIDKEAFYLTDTDLTKAVKFRYGSVSRRAGSITALLSSDSPANSPEAGKLYDVFLAWWEETRKTL